MCQKPKSHFTWISLTLALMGAVSAANSQPSQVTPKAVTAPGQQTTQTAPGAVTPAATPATGIIQTPFATPTPRPSPTPLTQKELDALVLPKDRPADTSSSFALLYSGYRHSMMEPCGCVSHQLGGMDKEGRIPVRIEELGIPTFKVDAGGFLKDIPNDIAILHTRYLLSGLSKMKYEAVNIGFPDLAAGLKFLKEEKTSESLPFISANVMDPATTTPLFDAFKVAELKLKSGKVMKIGVIGVTRPREATAAMVSDSARERNMGAEAPQTPEKDAWSIVDPVNALKSVLPKVKEQSDMIVLLAYMPREQAADLMGKLGPDAGINVVVAGEYVGRITPTVTETNGARIVSCGFEGRQLGELFVTTENGKPANYINMQIEILQSIPPVAELTKLIAQYRQTLSSMPVSSISPGAASPRIPQAQVTTQITYAGAAACTSCHKRESDQWKSTKHAKAMTSLIQKSAQFNPECVKCHVTGYKTDNGFVDYQITPQMAGVQCEVCHGPGYQHVIEKRRQQIMAQMGRSDAQLTSSTSKLKKNYTREACVKCHDAANDKYFDYERDIRLVDHSRVAQRPANVPVTQPGGQTAAREKQ